MSNYKRNLDSDINNRKVALRERMKTTSSSLKDYEQLLTTKEEITIYLELFLVIVSLVISLADVDFINSNLINVIITIIIINFGRSNYPLQKYKIRQAYLAMDRLFSDIDNSCTEEEITRVEYEYNNIFNLTENIPDYLYKLKIYKIKYRKSVEDISQKKSKFFSYERIDIIWNYMINNLKQLIYLGSDVLFTIMIMMVAIYIHNM